MNYVITNLKISIEKEAVSHFHFSALFKIEYRQLDFH